MRTRGLAVLVAAIGAVALVTPPSSALAATAGDAADQDAAAASIALGVPWRQSLDARWTWENAEPLPSTTRTLTVTIPPELFDFDSPLTALIVGAQRVPVTVISVDAPTRTVRVDIPEGYFDTAEPGMSSGSPRWSLVLQTSRPRPDGLAVPAYLAYDGIEPDGYYSKGAVSIGFDPGPPGATEHSRTVEEKDALRYVQRLSYWVDPADELALHGGDTLTVTGGPAMTDSGGGRLSSWDGGSVNVLPASARDGGVSVAMPTEENLSSLLNRSVILRIPYYAGGAPVDIGMPVTVVRTPSAGPGVTTRVAGYDRYWGSVAYSRELFGTDSDAHPTVTLTSGDKFADALSAAAATAHIGGSLLLVQPDLGGAYLTGDEAARLQPNSVVAIGGPASVSDQAAQEVAGAAGSSAPVRVGGQDRYEVSRKTAEQFWPDGAATVFVATGLDFPDALAAVPAAASQQAPVLLVPGTQNALNQTTLATLAELKTQHVVIVGGPVSVSPGIEGQLGKLFPGEVERITGSDRYEVSTAVNTRFFPTAEEAFVATGATFADALTGGVLAASKHAPLLLVRHDCVPASAHAALEAWGVSRTTLLDGPLSLESTVEDLVPCR